MVVAAVDLVERGIMMDYADDGLKPRRQITSTSTTDGGAFYR